MIDVFGAKYHRDSTGASTKEALRWCSLSTVHLRTWTLFSFLKTGSRIPFLGPKSKGAGGKFKERGANKDVA